MPFDDVSDMNHSLTPINESQGGGVSLVIIIDVYWCDAHGTRVAGWAHHGGASVAELTLETRSGRARTSIVDRPDLPQFFDDEPTMQQAGFEVYLPGPPDVELRFHGVSDGQLVHCVVPVPRHPLPVVPSATAGRAWTDAVRAAVSVAPPGPVLALGVRTASLEKDRTLRRLFAGREVIGVDIHPGIGVQVVADVHELDTHFAPGSVAIVYSGSLLEHVAAPWLVARACSAVLMTGGVAAHHAPWAWPTHAEPNDFWRMSPAGLGLLFGPELGFDVIESGTEADVRMHIEPDAHVDDDPRLALVSFSTTLSAAGSWLVARKIAAPVGSVAWPYRGTASAQRASQYPIDGLGAPNV